MLRRCDVHADWILHQHTNGLRNTRASTQPHYAYAHNTYTLVQHLYAYDTYTHTTHIHAHHTYTRTRIQHIHAHNTYTRTQPYTRAYNTHTHASPVATHRAVLFLASAPMFIKAGVMGGNVTASPVASAFVAAAAAASPASGSVAVTPFALAAPVRALSSVCVCVDTTSCLAC